VFEPILAHEGIYVGILSSSVFFYIEKMQQAERLSWESCRTTIIRYIIHNNEKPHWPAATLHRTAITLLNTHPVVLNPQEKRVIKGIRSTKKKSGREEKLGTEKRKL
jgi:hypothetical protein